MKTKQFLKKAGSLFLAGLVLLSTVISDVPKVDAYAAGTTKRVYLDQTNTPVHYDPGTPSAYTMIKRVTYSFTGTKTTTKAFCLQPQYFVPKDGWYDATCYSGTNDVSQCLYFADGAPGEDYFRQMMKKQNYEKYIKDSNQYYAFMHIVASYAYNSDSAFVVFDGSATITSNSKRLSDPYKKAVKYAYNWCVNKNIDTKNAFDYKIKTSNGNKSSAVASAVDGENYYQTEDFVMTATGKGKGQVAQITASQLPKGFSIYIKKSGGYVKATQNGSYINIPVDSTFCIRLTQDAVNRLTKDGKNSSTAISTTGKKKNLEAWLIKMKETKQNLGFFSLHSDASAKFTVKVKATPTTPTDPTQPSISTVLSEKGSGLKDRLEVSSSTTLNDVVSYENLPAGKYIAEGQLINKSTNKVVATASSKFDVSSTSKSGNVNVTFTFNSTPYDNETLVAFENIYRLNSSGVKESKAYISHENLEDSDQSVSFGKNGDNDEPIQPPTETTPSGKILIRKATRDVTGTNTTPEESAGFKVYNAGFSSYEEAFSSNDSKRRYAATVYTGSDGSALTPDLYAGSDDPGSTYKIQQISGKEGYKYATTRTVTVYPEDVSIVKDSGEQYIINKQYPLKIKIIKVDEGTGSTITTGTATFGIYRNFECTSLVATVSTEKGIATTSHLAAGTYYIKELTAPDGYDVNHSVKKVSLNYKNASYESGEYCVEAKVADTKTTYHDVIVKKTAEGGDWANALAGSSSEYQKLLNETFKFKATFENLEPSTKYTYSGGTFSSDSKGNATVDFEISLANGKKEGISSGFNTVKFKDIPSRATYKIEELGSKYLNGNVGYTASYTVTANKKSTKVPMKTGKPGQGVSTETERFPSNKVVGTTEENYPVEYTFNNSAIVRHNLVVKKTIAGEDADANDTFTYNIKLTNLTRKGSSYIVPGYTVYGNNEDGDRVVLALEERTTSTSSSYTYNIDLKADQVFEISQIDIGTNYTVTEKGSDYVPSYKKYSYVSGTDEPEKSIKDKTGTANNNLTGNGTMPSLDSSLIIQYDFTNTLNPDTVQATNRLNVEKFTNNGNTSDDFNYKVELSELEQSTTYAVIKKGNDSYYVDAADSSRYAALICTNKAKTKKIGGIAIEITRSDGRTKYLRTASNGELDLRNYISWIRQKGDDKFVISWEGGSFKATCKAHTNTFQCNHDEAVNASLTNCDITNFATKTNETTSTQTFTLKAGENISFIGLPEGSKYIVTESGNSYTPTYSIRRENIIQGTTISASNDTGKVNKELSTVQRIFPTGNSYADTVSFRNEKDTYDLDVEKSVTNGGSKTKEFIFDVDMSDLSESNYFAVIPGVSTYDISITTDGDLRVIQTNGSGTDFTGMPLVLTNPDGKEMTVLCNSAGIVSSDSYLDWLTGGKSGTIIFFVEFFGQKVKMSCTL